MKKILTSVFVIVLLVLSQNIQAQVDEPRFAGCKDSLDADCADIKMMQFIYSNLEHPKGNPGGKVLVFFTVKSDGTLADIAIEKGLTEDCDAEVVRIMEMMPSWHPAIKEGEAVDTEWELEIKFIEG